MKKLAIILCLTTAFAMSSVAQHRIGTDLGFGINSTIEKESTDKNCALTFVFEPSYSYAINEKLELGASMSLGTYQLMQEWEETHERYNDYGNYVTKTDQYKTRISQFNWSVNPFMRNRLIGHEKFGLWIESVANIGIQKDGYYKTTNETLEHDKNKVLDLHWGLNINPVLTYQFTEHFRMDATLGFLGIGLNGYTHFNSDGETAYSIIDFGAHLANGSMTSVIDHINTIVDAGFDGKIIAGRFMAKQVDLKIGFVYTF